MRDYTYLIGSQVVNADYSLVGTLTDVNGEYGTIDDDYEMIITDCDVINDLMGCHRERHPYLNACFVRLAQCGM